MSKREAVYKCKHCGNIVELMHVGGGTLVCCGEQMDLMSENTVDAAKEKHVPDYSRDGAILNVSVGTVDHPMEEKHYIEFVEVLAGDKIFRQYLKPGQPPKAQFHINSDNLEVRAYCNLHGLWKK